MPQQYIFSYLKKYPKSAKLIKYDRPYSHDNTSKQYNPDTATRSGGNISITPEQSEINHAESLRQSKKAISDYIACNEFDIWATFTFNGKKENIKKFKFISTYTDRQDIDLCRKKFQIWLNNQRKIHGKFRYVVVPEYHKDGAIHFHAFIGGYKGNIAYSGKQRDGKKVYKITSYRIGISDMVYIDKSPESINTVAKYIRKYITKDMPMTADKKRYWCSQKLIKPETVLNPLPSEIALYSFNPELQHKLEYLTIDHGTLKLKPQIT